MNSDTPDSNGWTFIRAWVLVSAFFSLLGWILAVSGHLTATGYTVGFLLGSFVISAVARRGVYRPHFHPKRRWRRPLPLTFAFLLGLVCLGATLYPPNNYDALTYRVPQILHWLTAGRWHWIAVSDRHINITPPGYGWFMAPMIALLQTDRLFALPNVVAFALMPGLLFTVLRGCGVRRQVAWHWMWLIPSASCLAMQAGSIGNDLLPAVYALAAVGLGLRAARRKNLRDFWWSALAAALITGVKITAAPLALPWVIVTLPCWKLLRARWLSSLVVAAVALVISYVPTAVGNILHTGSWNGDPENELKLQVDSPWHAVVGNSLMILVDALEPPVCPMANAVNARFQAVEETHFIAWLRQEFPRFDLHWGELASEESSGIGLGLSILAVVSALAGWFHRGSSSAKAPGGIRWVGLASFIAFGVYLAKMGSESAPRLAAPYYPFLLIPLLLSRGQEQVVRQRWWRMLAVLIALSILPAVILTPARPLWPARSILARLTARNPGSALLARARLVYEVYAQRNDDIAPLLSLLPSDGRAIGYVRAGNDIEGPLWKPYGSRKIVEILPPTPDISGVEHSVIIGARLGFEQKFGLTPADFATKVGGHIIGRALIPVKASVGPEEWVVIALDPSQTGHP